MNNQTASLNIDKTPTGYIIEVNGPVITMGCDILPPLYQALWTDTKTQHYILEVCQHI